ncbi:MAG: hypothetical protein GXP49_07965 [Deltaproteobacteria bacterium]|nr:hypothetical protein [Deltaproteobacteria bacterium]
MPIEDWKKGFIVLKPEQLEKIFAGAKWGHHLLFSAEQIQEAFRQEEEDLSDMDKETLDSLNKSLASLVSDSTTMTEKRSLVQEMPDKARTLLIYLYFKLLDQKMEETDPVIH